MKRITQEELELLSNMDGSTDKYATLTAELFFDDEPLGNTLYGVEGRGPTPANLFISSRGEVLKLLAACMRGDLDSAGEAASAIVEREAPLSMGMCMDITKALGTIFPNCPHPVLIHDLSAFGPLIAKIWLAVLESANEQEILATVPLLARWNEIHGNYGHARIMLLHVLRLHQKSGERIPEASTLNNIGFQFLLEKVWDKAMEYFAKAAALYHELGIVINHGNSRLNYWQARLSLKDWDDVAEAEAELKGYRDMLRGYGGWYERKPLVLLALIEESRGNLAEAARLVEEAIRSCTNSGTRYPEMDRAYLEGIKAKMDKS
jgi:hypothetical protein